MYQKVTTILNNPAGQMYLVASGSKDRKGSLLMGGRLWDKGARGAMTYDLYVDRERMTIGIATPGQYPVTTRGGTSRQVRFRAIEALLKRLGCEAKPGTQILLKPVEKFPVFAEFCYSDLVKRI